MSRPSFEDMITRAHIAIMSNPHWCWLTGVVLLGKWYTVPSQQLQLNVRGKKVTLDMTQIHTAATDGFDIWYNEDFLAKMWEVGKDQAIRSVVLHENLHKAYRHLSVWKHLFEKDPQRANQAVDVIANNDIAETTKFCLDFGKLSELLGMGFMHVPEWRGLTSGQVFDLLADPEACKKAGAPQPGQGQGHGDVHIPVGAGSDPAEGEEGQGDAMTDEIQAAMVDAAVRQGLAIQRGRDPAAAARNAAALAPKVDWRVALRNWISGKQFGYDLNNWRKRSRRSQSVGVFLPSHYSERTGELLIAVDTSGSIGGDLLGQFLGELASLCVALQPKKTTLVYWDGAIAGEEVYLPNQYRNIAQVTRPRGGGGTTLGCVKDYAKKLRNLRGIVVLTDGHVEGWHQGQWPADVFVVLNSSAPCPLPHVRI